MLRCCKSPSKYLITYDCGPQNSTWSVCEKHFQDEILFQKNIKEKKEIE
ncbi:MAG: hypothetical protein HN875_00630 [Candidatus Nitrosopelagicus sp.]|jgi:hypothetical protein|nr:hypothetical protein [Candidatus Nitrosopelagicus sp.]